MTVFKTALLSALLTIAIAWGITVVAGNNEERLQETSNQYLSAIACILTVPIDENGRDLDLSRQCFRQVGLPVPGFLT